MKPTLSPKEVAEAIGVSESSLKRWADAGRLRVSRTAGGHRRIAIAEAIRFIRATHAPIVRPEILGLSDVARIATEPPTDESDARRLQRYLEEGRAPEARGLILSMYVSGMSVAAISDGPIRHAMEEIGRRWLSDGDGVFIEHRATEICIEAVRQLQALLPPIEDGPLAVGGAPEGDTGVLSSLLAATVVTTEGFRAVNLGAQTPLATLRSAAAHHQARLVWLSITHPCDLDALASGLTDLATRLADIGAKLLVGGRQASGLLKLLGEEVCLGESMAELAAFARGLLIGIRKPGTR